MATERYIAGSGVGFTWTNCFAAADLNSLASGSSVLSSQGDITNQTALDMFADISIALGSVTTLAPNTLSFFLYPLDEDGTSYGDNVFTAGTQSVSTPSPSYWIGDIVVPVGTQTLKGMLPRVLLIPGTLRFLVQNNTGVALAASANSIQYRTYNRQVA